MSVNEEQAYQVSSKSLQQYQVSCQFAYVFAPPYLRFWMSIVKNMECRFPAMLVLLLGREFYRGMYGNSGGMEPSTLDLSEKLGGHFGD
ncbi:hypothetical protein AVEN_176479-1 [Araneus ventricosus]|uniref:Uncharacterized protein n=1 Tax=Araneus ventricosus TaxID=182803 RepID=A0A4Y2TRY0_ARAVE|nr:hypothetical protein AVEN_176479-1 [Araneus ventricosus]